MYRHIFCGRSHTDYMARTTSTVLPTAQSKKPKHAHGSKTGASPELAASKLAANPN
jgi:hypothetical protein